MSLVSVDVVVRDKSRSTPIDAVVVRALSADGKEVLAQGETDGTGVAALLLPFGQYQLRFFKPRVYVKQPLMLELLEGDAAALTVHAAATPLDPPLPQDARACVAYGVFRWSTGLPAAGVELTITPEFPATWVDGSGVVPGRIRVVADKEGYVQVPLFRFGQYEVSVAGMSEYTRTVYVPDAPNININDLLFPVAEAVTFDPAGPFSLRVGEEKPVATTVLLSDGRQLPGTGGEVRWKSSDPSVLVVLSQTGGFLLRALSAGTVEVTAERTTDVVRIPSTPLVGVPVQITVVP